MRNFKVVNKRFVYLIIVILLLISVSCGRLNTNTARTTFLKENPTYTIVNSYTGEGWDGVAYHHFEYKKPSDNKIYKEMWCFEQKDDNTWKVTSKTVDKLDERKN